MSKKVTKAYASFIPNNLQEELDFLGVMLESNIITEGQFIDAQNILEKNGYIPNSDPNNFVTGNDFYFEIIGKDTIDKFIENMNKYFGDRDYKISNRPFGKLNKSSKNYVES